MTEYWATIFVAGEPVGVGAFFDDLNGFARQRITAIAHSDFVAKEISTLGLFLSSKSQPLPSQQSTVLGYEIDTRTLQARLPALKRQRIQQRIRSCLKSGLLSAREALSLAGRLMDARFASTLFRAAAYALYPHTSSAPDWDTPVEISIKIKDRLRFLLRNLPLLNSGQPFRYNSTEAIQLVSDASLKGWAVVIMTGPYDLRAQSRRSSGVPSGGGMALPLPRPLAPHSLHAASSHPVPVQPGRPRHASQEPGLCVDRTPLSREDCIALGSVLDLFASSVNAVAPRYFARLPLAGEAQDAGAIALDAMQQSWQGLRKAWIFPPVELLDLVIHKILADRPQGAVLIVPHLPNPHWWPRHQQLSGDTRTLQTSDFKVDGLPTSSIFLSLATRFEARQTLWPR